jgi:arylsulfatase
MRMISSAGASVGFDHGSPVSRRYHGAFPFTGTLHEVVIQLAGPRRSDVGAAEAAQEMSRQ